MNIIVILGLLLLLLCFTSCFYNVSAIPMLLYNSIIYRKMWLDDDQMILCHINFTMLRLELKRLIYSEFNSQ